MEFAALIPHLGDSARAGVTEAFSREAEDLGFATVFANDHVLVPSDEKFVPDKILDPLIVMAVAAAATERIRIGASVLVIPYRDPIVLAGTLATLDEISNGRIILGTGVGWMEKEFEALGIDFHRRGAICDEYLAAMKTLWTSDPTSFRGRDVNFEDIRVNPKPRQEPLPMWVGGNLDASIRRAATQGTGWHPLNLGPDEFEERMGVYRDACAKQNKPIGEVCLRIMPRGRRKWTVDRPPFTGTPEEIAQDAKTYGDLGLTQLLFDPAGPNPEECLKSLRFLGKEVIPRVNS